MSEDSGHAALEAEVRTLRREVAELRAEQRDLARSIEELTRTFRALAAHLGIAAEPYRRSGDPGRDAPGFA